MFVRRVPWPAMDGGGRQPGPQNQAGKPSPCNETARRHDAGAPLLSVPYGTAWRGRGRPADREIRRAKRAREVCGHRRGRAVSRGGSWSERAAQGQRWRRSVRIGADRPERGMCSALPIGSTEATDRVERSTARPAGTDIDCIGKKVGRAFWRSNFRQSPIEVRFERLSRVRSDVCALRTRVSPLLAFELGFTLPRRKRR